MMQAVFAAEAFLRTVDADDMTRDQLEIRAIRKILDSYMLIEEIYQQYLTASIR